VEAYLSLEEIDNLIDYGYLPLGIRDRRKGTEFIDFQALPGTPAEDLGYRAKVGLEHPLALWRMIREIRRGQHRRQE
jgi:hypothetical protein